MILTPGTVLYLYFTVVRPNPKEKFALLGAIEPSPMLLFIDTDINPFVNNTDELRSHHLLVPQLDHEFLKYDSWIDCTYPVGYDLALLASTVQRSPEKICGTIGGRLRMDICAKVSSSRLWPAKKKERFVSALSNPTPFEF